MPHTRADQTVLDAMLDIIRFRFKEQLPYALERLAEDGSADLRVLLLNGKKTKKAKDPNAPKRPLSPYIIFCNKMRSTVRDEMAGKPPAEVTSELGRRWRALSDNEKAVYKQTGATAPTTKASAPAPAPAPAKVVAKTPAPPPAPVAKGTKPTKK